MRFSSVALTAMAVGGAVASHHNHARLHEKMHKSRAAAPKVDKRGETILDSVGEALIEALGLVSAGTNAIESGSEDVWIGDDGDVTNEFVNQGSDDVVLVVWGPSGSWVNVNVPLITASIPAGTNKTLSFTSSASGAWSVIYNDTSLVNGQISETWGEFTMGDYGTIDVSREVNMEGHNMTIVTPNCVSDMDTCVFVCEDGATSCWLEYELKNCETGSQVGASYGEYDGAPSGGCTDFGDNPALVTYLN